MNNTVFWIWFVLTIFSIAFYSYSYSEVIHKEGLKFSRFLAIIIASVFWFITIPLVIGIGFGKSKTDSLKQE